MGRKGGAKGGRRKGGGAVRTALRLRSRALSHPLAGGAGALICGLCAHWELQGGQISAVSAVAAVYCAQTDGGILKRSRAASGKRRNDDEKRRGAQCAPRALRAPPSASSSCHRSRRQWLSRLLTKMPLPGAHSFCTVSRSSAAHAISGTAAARAGDAAAEGKQKPRATRQQRMRGWIRRLRVVMSVCFVSRCSVAAIHVRGESHWPSSRGRP